MAGYTDPDRYSSMKDERFQTLGVQAASYGVGFFIYGIIGLASGQLLGLGGIRFLDEHHLGVSVGFMVLGALLLAFGWRRPE